MYAVCISKVTFEKKMSQYAYFIFRNETQKSTDKGQLISKALLGILLPKNEQTNSVLLQLGKKSGLVCSFFGKIRGYQKCF